MIYSLSPDKEKFLSLSCEIDAFSKEEGLEEGFKYLKCYEGTIFSLVRLSKDVIVCQKGKSKIIFSIH